ncbi:hypothetical protein W02_06160 [Nitrospira sp. KM1]|uniref:hypothetical protein n=1 Tax=Nitrospira sp. KM1 TaxID=1936990 RepID=UPI0013A753F0|nr:hypothetical protein [Nitrospira sp. KM1]BCA53476.1 hypothetical protein W02_06160 [Nitrospira sp. KM1]
MPTKQRKVEVYRLTISGLEQDSNYGRFVLDVRRKARRLSDLAMKAGDKSYVLSEAKLEHNYLRLRFMSFTKGYRPDVLDTEAFHVQPNPLTDTQTSVEWTHLLGRRCGVRYMMLIERNQRGIWPSSVEHYLQWMIDKFHNENTSNAAEPVTVSLEAEPGPEFIRRLGTLDRITEATVRIVRPNPGWQDLDTELGIVARESDAHKAEVTLRARRRSSLKRQGGFIQWIRSKLGRGELGYAAIKGRRGVERDSFNTEKLGKHALLDFEINDRGQVTTTDVWTKMTRMMDDLQ